MPLRKNKVNESLTANTIYFFDVARGGRSYTDVDLKAMGLKKSQNGHWFWKPGADSSESTLKELENRLNVYGRPWSPKREGISETPKLLKLNESIESEIAKLIKLLENK